MTRLVVHCLHGMLQTPAVWAGLEARLSAGLPGEVRVIAEGIDPPDAGGAPAWAAAFCRRVAGVEGSTPDVAGARVLLGYSLGGRLAMHALLSCPELWSAAILIAAHPGGGDDAEREAVRRRDARWAERCRGEPWPTLLADWDGLPVFGGRPNQSPRSPDDLDPELCAQMFTTFSRADQADLRAPLADAPLPPILYVTGTEDSRYGALGAELAALVPSLGHAEVEDAGHRVPWDQPESFATMVGRFLREPRPSR